MKHILLAVFFILVIIPGILAQSQLSYQEQYKKAKALFKNKQYKAATEAFAPLTEASPENPFTEYAYYYQALSAYYSGNLLSAKNTFLRLSKKYAYWDNYHETLFWLSTLHFELKEYEKGIFYAEMISRSGFREEAKKTKLYHLSKVEDLSVLKQLYEQHPNDKTIATALAYKIKDLAPAEQDNALLKSLEEKFNLNINSQEVVVVDIPQKTVLKERYNVAVLLPFMLKSIPADFSNDNFVFELYEGMKLAVRELEKEGIKIDIFAYDTQKDSIKTAEILALPEMKQMDLIIGPLFPSTCRQASVFSHQYKINLFNPLSTNRQVIGANPYAFLLNPSLETQARKAALFAAKNFPNKSAFIFYGPSQKDETLARAYREEIEEKGFHVIAMEEVTDKKNREIVNILKKEYPATSPEDVMTDSLGQDIFSLIDPLRAAHVFTACTDELSAAKVVSAVETLREEFILVSQGEWLDFKFLTYEQLEQLNICLLAPGFIDYNQKSVADFRSLYLETVHTLPPGQYVYLGYDKMLFLGRMIGEHGVYFQNKMREKGFIPGTMVTGYEYRQSNDNQLVPIVKFNNGKLVLVDQ